MSGKIVILILGIAKLFDMITSVNELIISYSKYFRFNLFALLVLAVLNVIANLIFIPYFDIAGAALATLLSIVLYNSVKTIFIYTKYRIHPFQGQMFKIGLLTGGLYLIGSYMPSINNAFLSIGLKSILLVTVFVYFVLKLKISQEASDLWEKLRSMALAIFNK